MLKLCQKTWARSDKRAEHYLHTLASAHVGTEIPLPFDHIQQQYVRH